MIYSVSKLEKMIEMLYQSFGLNVADLILIDKIKGLSEGKILKGTDLVAYKVRSDKINNWGA